MLSTKSALPLFCLSHAVNPITGYDLTKHVRAAWSHQQVYRELGKLEAAGYLTHSVKYNNGKPDSKVYSLTTLGKMAVPNYLFDIMRKRIDLGDEMPRHFIAAMISAKENGLINEGDFDGLLEFWGARIKERIEAINEVHQAQQKEPNFAASSGRIYGDKILALKQSLTVIENILPSK